MLSYVMLCYVMLCYVNIFCCLRQSTNVTDRQTDHSPSPQNGNVDRNRRYCMSAMSPNIANVEYWAYLRACSYTHHSVGQIQ